MKKTSFKIIIGLCLLGLLAFLTSSSHAQTAQSKPFLSGFNLAVVSTTTNLFNATNIYAKGFYVTNSGTYPYTSSIVAVTVTNPGAIADVPLWANRDGTTPLANISVQIHGLNAAFMRNPIVWIPALDGDTNNPIYMINHSVFEPVGLEGDYLKETRNMAPQNHNIEQYFVDLTYNYKCVDRRRCGVLYAA